MEQEGEGCGESVGKMRKAAQIGIRESSASSRVYLIGDKTSNRDSATLLLNRDPNNQSQVPLVDATSPPSPSAPLQLVNFIPNRLTCMFRHSQQAKRKAARLLDRRPKLAIAHEAKSTVVTRLHRTIHKQNSRLSKE